MKTRLGLFIVLLVALLGCTIPTLAAVETQLQFQPDVETRNRKPLKHPVVFGAKWETRFGPDNRFRVFYRVDYENEQVVLLAIGEKIGSRLFISGEELEI